MLGPAKYSISPPHPGESAKNFRMRLQNAGAMEAFESRVKEVKMSSRVPDMEAWLIAAKEFGFASKEIDEKHWTDEAKRARKINGVGLLGLGGFRGNRPANKNELPKAMRGENAIGRDGLNSYQRLALMAKGRKSSPTADAMWAYENANVPVEQIDVHKIPSPGAITLLKMAHMEPDKFIAQVVAKLVLKGAEREMDEKSAFRSEDDLLMKAKDWAERTSMDVMADAYMEAGDDEL